LIFILICRPTYARIKQAKHINMKNLRTNRFQGFFAETKYTTLKNYLYNYLLRKMIIEKNLQGERLELILEVGSGISPVITRTSHVIYSDFSFTAVKALKQSLGMGWYVVADGMYLPFKSGVFSHTISSEVLEHLKDDRQAINEISRVMQPEGHFIITFPHRQFYFGNDDRFVGHYRRYELNDMIDRLNQAGLEPVHIQKVLGPLEKATMSTVVFCYDMIQKFIKKKKEKGIQKKPFPLMKSITFLFKWANRMYMALAWLDARIWPRWFSTILLINSIKTGKIGARPSTS
jgi:ubiquinone/menaquinone biosynthesis C-methylase UbiE